jgi:hypothetical protein
MRKREDLNTKSEREDSDAKRERTRMQRKGGLGCEERGGSDHRVGCEEREGSDAKGEDSDAKREDSDGVGTVDSDQMDSWTGTTVVQ